MALSKSYELSYNLQWKWLKGHFKKSLRDASYDYIYLFAFFSSVLHIRVFLYIFSGV